MRKKVKEDEVSISFHSLVRTTGSGEDAKQVKFSKETISTIYDHLTRVSELDLNNETISDQVRYRDLAPIIRLERVDERTVCGQYEASYWGHSYKNSKAGKITAESINLRPFFFLIYLSKSGRIYVGSQYLGTFGGYTAIKNTIMKAFDKRSEIKSTSFNFASENFKDAIPKKLMVDYYKKGASITSPTKLGQKGVFTFTFGKDDEDLKDEVKSKLLIKDSPREIRKAVAKVLNEAEVIEISDDEIENCRILAQVNGRPKTIFLIEGSNYATKFYLKTPLTSQGHPKFKKIKEKALKVLRQKVLTRTESG